MSKICLNIISPVHKPANQPAKQANKHIEDGQVFALDQIMIDCHWFNCISIITLVHKL